MRINRTTKVFLFFLVSACNKQHSDHLERIMTDRIWESDVNESQFYLSSQDHIEYIWNAVERKDNRAYYKNVPAKGTPSTLPYEPSWSEYSEGWQPLNHFKFKGDTLMLQDQDDLDGSSVTEYHIKIGKDTAIGVFDYVTLLVTNEYGTRVWRSKK